MCVAIRPFCAPGHIDTLFPVRAMYPEPRTRPYEIRKYPHRSSLRALTYKLGTGAGGESWKISEPKRLGSATLLHAHAGQAWKKPEFSKNDVDQDFASLASTLF